MRSIAAATVFCLAPLLTAPSYGQTAADAGASAKPMVFALVAAFGDQFGLATEVQSTGSHLSPYRHWTSKAENDTLNRVALNSLDKAIVSLHPDSKRIYLSLPAAQLDRVAPSERETAAINAIVAALAQVPQRLEWDRIVVATPAYRALELHGLPGRLQGFGMFAEPVCQGCAATFDGNPAVNLLPGSAKALTSENETIQAKTYIAPFSYIELWILDPKTLAVLDREVQFDSQKLAEPGYKPLRFDVDRYLASRMTELIELSVSQAVGRSEINDRQGKVEVGEPKRVDPDVGGN
jgi:hypothetical protein